MPMLLLGSLLTEPGVFQKNGGRIYAKDVWDKDYAKYSLDDTRI
jgi:hypothetical protein